MLRLIHTIHTHGRRSVGEGGTRPPHTFQPGGDSIGNVPPTFSDKKNLQAYSETDHSSLLKQTLRLAVKFIYQFRYKLPTTQWKITG